MSINPSIFIRPNPPPSKLRNLWPLTLFIQVLCFSLQAAPEISIEQPVGVPLEVGLVAWGRNTSGQTSIPPDLKLVRALAAGLAHTVALRTDGTVVAWGDNSAGQCTAPSTLTGVMAIAAGAYHTVALRDNGTVVAWGDNTRGQTIIPASLQGSSVTAIAAGQFHNVAKTSNGSVVAWGDNSRSQSVVPPELNGVTAVAAGAYHTIALKSDGTSVSWGSNSVPDLSPPPGLTGTIAVTAGLNFSAALSNTGAVTTWGNEESGQLLIPTDLSHVAAIFAGASHTIARRTDGTLSTWGDITYGQTSPPPNIAGVTSVAAGGAHSVIAKKPAVSFGFQEIASTSISRTFTIRNTGNTALSISSVALTGDNAADFILNKTGMLASLPALTGTTTFTAAFRPGASGLRQTTLRVLSDDSDEGSFDISLTGLGALPKMAVYGTPTYNGGGTLISNEDTTPSMFDYTDLGDCPLGNTKSGYFTIANEGPGSLILTSTPIVSISGTNAADFYVASQPASPIAAYTGKSSLQVAARPLGLGLRSATITIRSNDPARTPYQFGVQVTGTPAYVAQIAVVGNAMPISDGDTTPAAVDNTDFGIATLGADSVSRGYSIYNNGPQELTLSTAPTITGSNAGDFILSRAPAARIGTGATTAFEVQFRPTAAGLRSAILTIQNNDRTHPRFTFTIQGFAVSGQLSIELPAGQQLTSGVVTWGSFQTSAFPLGMRPNGLKGLALASGHAAVLKGDGTVFVWGQNPRGINTPPEGLSGVTSLAAGTAHLVALQLNGQVTSWGSTASGGKTNFNDFSDGAFISAGSDNSTAVNRAGTLTFLTGYSSLNGLLPTGLTDIRSVSEGQYHTLALRNDGTVIAWGQNASGESTVPPGLSGIMAVAAGNGHSVALKLDGTVTAWGDNTRGQLNIPTELGFVVAIAAGSKHTLALKRDGTVSAWGDNSSGQLTVPLGLSGIRFISAKGDSSGAAKGTDCIDFGTRQTGATALSKSITLKNSGPQTRTLRNLEIVGEDEKDFSVNLGSLAVGTPLAVGASMISVGFSPKASGIRHSTLCVRCDEEPPLLISLTGNGEGASAEIFGNGKLVKSGSLVPSPDDFTDFGSARLGGDSVTRTFTIRNLGAQALNLHGIPKLGIGGSNSADYTLTSVPPPLVPAQGGTATFQITFTPSSLGLRIATVTVPNSSNDKPAYQFNIQGTGVVQSPTIEVVEPGRGPLNNTVVAWGDNSAGQTSVPAGLPEVIAISAGASHSLALRRDGTVAAWGDNTYGQTTVPDNLRGVTAISAGRVHSVALRQDGTVAVFGGQNYPPDYLKAPNGLNTVKAIAAGNANVVALKTDGTLAAWGINDQQQNEIPSGLSNVTAIGTGPNYSAALKADSTIVNWGSQTIPIPVDLAGIDTISTGPGRIVALRRGGKPMVFAAYPYQSAQPPFGLSGVEAISAGDHHTMALGSGGILTSWGAIWNDTDRAILLVPTGLAGVTRVSAGLSHTLALRRLVTFGSVPVGTAFNNRTLTIRNTGTSELVLGNTTLTGVNSSDFIVDESATLQTIAPLGGSTTLTVRFRPGGLGDRKAALTIESNDPLERKFVIGLSGDGSGEVPEIVVSSGVLPVPAGDQAVSPLNNTDFGVVKVGTNSLAAGYAISNAGSTPLHLTGTPVIEILGEAAGDFIATRQPGTSISPHESNTFLVVFTPSSAGLREATVRIRSDDYDEPIFDFQIQGTGAPPSPEISLEQLSGQALGNRVIAWGTNVGVVTSLPRGWNDITAIASGTHHSLALRSNGTVVAWDTSGYGITPIPEGLQDVTAIAAGGYHSAALKSDGTVVAWGSNAAGESTPPSDLMGVSSISACGENTIALKNDRSIVGWGSNASGQTSTPSGLTDVVAVACAGNQSAALSSFGTVTLWGYPSDTLSWITNSLTDVVKIAPGLALRRDGTIVRLDSGEVMTGPSSSGIVSLALSRDFLLAAREDGTVLTAGSDGIDRNILPTGMKAITSVALGDYHAVALQRCVDFGTADNDSQGITKSLRIRNSGTDRLLIQNIAITGTNPEDFTLNSTGIAEEIPANGGTAIIQVKFIPRGLGSRIAFLHIESNDPVRSAYDAALVGEGTGIAPEISLSGNSLSIPHGDRTPSSTDHTDFGSVDVVLGNRTRVFSISNTGTGSLHLGTIDGVTINGPAAQAFSIATQPGSSIEAGNSTTLQIIFDPQTVGLNTATVSIRSDDPDESLFEFAIQGVGLEPVPKLAVASRDGREFGSSALSWGKNNYGQTAIPAGLANVVSIRAGAYHTLALKADGTVSGWGYNLSRQISIPAGLNGVSMVAAGETHSVALKYDGSMVAWGYNDLGGTNIPAGLSGITALVAGDQNTLAVKRNGTVVGWGNNTRGNLDIPSGLSGIKSVVTGYDFSAALKSDGSIVVWGQDSNGLRNIPQNLGFITDISAKSSHILALRQNGTVVAWGYNNYGQTAVPSGLTDVKAIATGALNSIAIKNDSTVVSWGYNLYSENAVPSALTNPTAISGGNFFECAINGISIIDFGRRSVASPGSAKMVSLRSTGTAPLMVSGTSILGTHASDFALLAPPLPATFDAQVGHADLSIVFTPRGEGRRGAFLRIKTNDPNQPDFDIALVGAGALSPAISVSPDTPTSQNHTLNANAPPVGLPSVALGAGTSTRTFTVANTGLGTLNLGSLTVWQPSQTGVFAITQPDSVKLGPGERTAFNISLTPSQLSSSSAVILIPSNDPDVSLFQLSVTCHVVSQEYAAWRQEKFGTSGDTGSSASLSDPDFDGQSNLVEFALASNPMIANSRPAWFLASETSVSAATFVYTRSKAAVAGGIIFSVEWSTTLDGEWKTNGLSHSLADLGSTEVVSTTISRAAGGRVYFRLRISEP